MKPLFVSSLILLFSSLTFAAPYHTITIDGDMSDWSSDEIVAADQNDSTFDPGTGKNEIQNLYVTWDRNNLYCGIEGQSNNNGMLLYFDVNPGDGKGQGNLFSINTWNRHLIFQGSVSLPGGTTVPFLPDFFYGSWDGSGGNFYSLPSSITVQDVSAQVSLSTSRTSKKPGLELRIPFSALYGLGDGNIPAGARIAMVAALAPGGDFLGGDSAPNNVNNVALTNFTSSTLNNFVLVQIDKDRDSIPDNTFSGITRLEMTRPVMNPNPFAPTTTGSAKSTNISFFINLPSNVSVRIFDMAGRQLRNLVNETVSFQQSPQRVDYTWDGKDENGEIVPVGIYVVNVRASSSFGGARENAAVAVVK